MLKKLFRQSCLKSFSTFRESLLRQPRTVRVSVLRGPRRTRGAVARENPEPTHPAGVRNNIPPRSPQNRGTGALGGGDHAHPEGGDLRPVVSKLYGNVAIKFFKLYEILFETFHKVQKNIS